MVIKYKIKGMHCASCAMKVELAVEKVPGVKEAKVSLTSGDLEITCDCEIKAEDVCGAVSCVGYEAVLA
jgi:copper chaperone CopZ